MAAKKVEAVEHTIGKVFEQGKWLTNPIKAARRQSAATPKPRVDFTNFESRMSQIAGQHCTNLTKF